MAGLRAGFSEVVITPPIGVRLCGYSARTGASTGVLDDLYAKAMVLEEGKRRIAVVVSDLLQLDRDIVTAVRKRLGETVGFDPSCVLVAATHTHCGPDLDLLDESSIDHLVAQIAGAVYGASLALEDAKVGFGRGECSVGANRRFPTSPSGPYFLYNDPTGPFDPSVTVMTVRKPSGDTMGALVNYACHPVTLGDDELGISKDYLHFTCATLKDAWGTGAAALFLQGCTGNINPNWIWDRPEITPPPERSFPAELAPRLRETARLGRILGGEALKTAESVVSLRSDCALGAVSRTVDLPVRRDMSREMNESLETLKGSGAYAKRRYRNVLHVLAEGGETYPAEVQVLRIGEGLIVGLPGEIFVEYQMEIRKRLAGRPVLIVSMANDCVHYIPTPQAFNEGGYEPMVAWFAPEAGALLVDQVLFAAEELRVETVRVATGMV